MTFKEGYNKATTWQRRIILISLFHNAHKSKQRNWKLIDSAKYFQCSIGLISESLNLSQHWDDIKDCHSRSEALKKVKK